MRDIKKITDQYRKQIIKTAWNGQGGHITSALSMVDILSVLYFGEVLRHNPRNPQWSKRDRFILSKAHGGVGLYTILGMCGYYPMEDLKDYCKPNQHMGDHSSMMVQGIECSGGSLGHGLGIAAGKAMAAKLKKEDYLTYVITGDGECQEGSIWEAALFIGNNCLNNLIWIIDYNRLQANGWVNETSSLEPLEDKLKSFGFEVLSVDGHNQEELFRVLSVDRAHLPSKPRVIIARTIKGYGVPLFQDKEGWHGRTPKKDEYQQIVQQLGMTWKEFEEL